MYDLHTHSTWSDGCLIPAELVQRARVAGYKGIGITDHCDASNMELLIERIGLFCEEIRKAWKDILVVPGIELTHNPPSQIPMLARRARKLGAGLVVVHGETPVEPVPKGTNRAAIRAGVDVLAHPGMIGEEDVKLARKNNVLLEITAKRGHSLGNGHVAQLARRCKAPLVFNTDAHAPEDLFSKERLRRIVAGSGLSSKDLKAGQSIARKLLAERSQR